MPMRLERLRHSRQDAKRLDAALAVYRQTILPEARNPQREILYWIDHDHGSNADFRCFAVEEERRVVGYLQYSYFATARCCFVEYVCFLPGSGAKAKDLWPQLRSYLGAAYDRPRFMVGEAAFRPTTSGGWERDAGLVRLATRFGFGRIDVPYRYPALNSAATASSYPADLLVACLEQATPTSADVLEIIRCIYFDHYIAWDRPFLAPEKFDARAKLIDHLYHDVTGAKAKGREA